MRRNGDFWVGLVGFNDTPWRSLRRTERFYLAGMSALGARFEYLHNDAHWFESEPDIAVQFSGGQGWTSGDARTCPLLMVVHGGCILNHSTFASQCGALRTTDTLIVNCTSDVAILSEMYRQGRSPRVALLRLPVDTIRFQRGDIAKARRALGLGTEDFVIGYVGRILPQRNLHLTIGLAEKMRRRLGSGRPIKVLVVGERWVDYPVLRFTEVDYGSYLAKQIERLGLVENVVYCESLDTDAELAACYSAMDVLFHPTNAIDENFGYVPLEAMACETPVVAFAYGGIKDSVLDGETGYLIPTWVTRNGIRHDIGHLWEVMRGLWHGDLPAERLGKAARRHVIANYSFQQFGKTLTDILFWAEENISPEMTPCEANELTYAAKANDLPRVDPSWSYYEPAVAHYVSTRQPTLDSGSEILLSADYRRKGSRWQSLDPAWPITFEAAGMMNRIVELLLQQEGGSLSVDAMSKQLGLNVLPCLQGMVERGILASNGTSN